MQDPGIADMKNVGFTGFKNETRERRDHRLIAIELALTLAMQPAIDGVENLRNGALYCPGFVCAEIIVEKASHARFTCDLGGFAGAHAICNGHRDALGLKQCAFRNGDAVGIVIARLWPRA